VNVSLVAERNHGIDGGGVPRRAHAATSALSARTINTAVRLTGSVGVSPGTRNIVSGRMTNTAANRPIAEPGAVSHTASLTTRRTIAPGGAEREPHANLRDATRDRIRRHAVETDRREQKSQQANRPQQRRADLTREKCQADAGLSVATSVPAPGTLHRTVELEPVQRGIQRAFFDGEAASGIRDQGSGIRPGRSGESNRV
jgi:hypothetical protein